MSERPLLDSDGAEFCRLRYYPARQQLSVSWLGYIDGARAQEGARASLETVQQHACRCLLNDNTHLRGPWFDSLLWVAQQWAPAAATAGLRYVAHVVRAGTLATTFIASPAHQLFTQFEIQIFDSLAEANEWLLGCAFLPAPASPQIK
ncbi:hypothetical protein CDA63_14345 [Hymenobacter amundsenii]|uniref:STAS/SEC14 domain-containing protein n=1 Tax=Hymenobacter amundsenii TaxID=2006685 RepID=A0A246FIK0_9BACT|nr:hypothetical protein [Hymenobacter amundsenii]OWP62366.1 hypothetical protein CDA63_14345 [Hymenobacter amundsenii]